MDPILAAASGDIAVGALADLSIPGHGVAGVRFFYTSTGGRVISANLVTDTDIPPWLHKVTWLVAPGDELRPQPGRFHFARVGYAVVTADTIEQCASRMRVVEQKHELHLAPQ